MLIRRDARTSLIAFGCACAAHAAIVAWMSRVPPPPTAGRASNAIEPAPTIVRLPPPDDDNAIGEETGQGESAARVDLPDVTRSPDPHEFEQAWTRQQPTLSPPPMPEAPAPEPTPLGPTLPQVAIAPPPNPTLPREVSPEGTIVAEPEPQREPSEAPQEPIEAPPQQAVASASATPEPPKPRVTPPSPPSAPPDPGEKGPSDLDAFAKAEGVDFTRGGIQARTGRPVKLVRPRVDLGFMADATVLGGRKSTILLRIETGADGKPTRVEIVKSSGSRQIDDSIRLAMYASWFGGKMPDAFPFGITLWQ